MTRCLEPIDLAHKPFKAIAPLVGTDIRPPDSETFGISIDDRSGSLPKPGLPTTRFGSPLTLMGCGPFRCAAARKMRLSFKQPGILLAR
jgi:hypothetical protein